MSKSILIIDTPKSCTECKLIVVANSKLYCPLIRRVGEAIEINKWVNEKMKHHRCPLQDTTELLEALGMIGNQKDYMGYSPFKESMSIKSHYNKLHKALGGTK